MAGKRLIDANALLRSEVKRCGCIPSIGSGYNNETSFKLILDQATTVDAVEVVRCRDCIMYEEHINERTRFCRLNLGHSYADPNGFCSYGERRKNAED